MPELCSVVPTRHKRDKEVTECVQEVAFSSMLGSEWRVLAVIGERADPSLSATRFLLTADDE